jgi:cell division protein FtsQ
VSAAVALPRRQASAPRKPAARRPLPPRGQAAGVRLPVAPATARRVLGWGLVGLLAAMLVAALLAMRVPQRIADWVMATSARAGFEVADVRVTGTVHVDPEAVKAAALEGGSSLTFSVSPEAIRERLLALPWVRDATVMRRLPDRLDIEIVERVPAALWQLHGRTTLIDAAGHALPVSDLGAWAKLPLIVGAGADAQYSSLLALLATQPGLTAKVDAASWIGGRRWDLTLKSHETLSLPEGNDRAQTALAAFLALDAKQSLTGGTFARFDLRLPGKLVVRLAHPPVDAKAKKGTAI